MEEKQSSRIFYLDFARGLAIFFMIMQHTMIMHEKTGGEGNTILGNIFILLGTAPAAPVFMLIMGAFFAKSNKSITEGILRGLKLFILGYILNLVRFTIPISISGSSSFLGKESISMLFEVDILQLAGLSLIVASLLKKYTVNKYIFPISILVILIVSPYLWGRLSGNPIFIPLWGTEVFVSFPFFPWVIYPLLGMYLSKYLLDQSIMEKVKKKLLIYGILIIIIGVISFDIFPVGDYFRSGLGVHFTMIGFVLLWLVIGYHFTQKIGLNKNNLILKTLVFWSRNVTIIYIIQWILFGWSILLVGVNQKQDFIAAFIGLSILLITHLVVKYTNIKRVAAWI